jgi:hypothetical protein
MLHGGGGRAPAPSSEFVSCEILSSIQGRLDPESEDDTCRHTCRCATTHSVPCLGVTPVNPAPEDAALARATGPSVDLLSRRERDRALQGAQYAAPFDAALYFAFALHAPQAVFLVGRRQCITAQRSVSGDVLRAVRAGALD